MLTLEQLTPVLIVNFVFSLHRTILKFARFIVEFLSSS